MNPTNLRIAVAASLVAGGVFAVSSNVGAQGIGIEEFERMLVPTPRKIERGKRIYQNQCAGCHGENGQGIESYPNSKKFDHDVPDFTEAQYRHGGGPIQIYNAVTHGLDGEYHPQYDEALRYQERWAVTHYVRSLGPTDDLTDPPEVVAKARERAEKGTCEQSVKKTISSKLEPKGEEQMNRGKELYSQQCASCHGENGKGDGPAGQALNPPPRNYHDPEAQWTNGTSPLAMFNTLTNGIQGTSMSSYASLSEEDRWALVHYTRQWIPESKREESTEEDVLAVCRNLSAPEPPESIPVEQAMEAMIDDQPEERATKVARYGQPKVADDADPERGREIYSQECAQCHGSGLNGARLGPYAVLRSSESNRRNPRLRFEVRGLLKRHAGGTYRDFARRAASGVHATLPGMSRAALMSDAAWKDLHAFVARNGRELEVGRTPDWMTGPETPSQPADDQTDETTNGADAGTAPATGSSGAPSEPAATPDAGSSTSTQTNPDAG